MVSVHHRADKVQNSHNGGFPQGPHFAGTVRSAFYSWRSTLECHVVRTFRIRVALFQGSNSKATNHYCGRITVQDKLRQATRAQCIATIWRFMEIQKQLLTPIIISFKKKSKKVMEHLVFF